MKTSKQLSQTSQTSKMSGYICKSCRISMRRALLPRRLHSLYQARRNNSDAIRPLGKDPNQKIEDSKDLEEVHNDKQEAPQPQDPQITRFSNRSYIDIASLLSKPTWSVRSLLPDPNTPPQDEITPEKLHHLLRLSALPLPKSKSEEDKILETLHSHLHFVRDIQKVDTDGVEPLRNIRDETEEGIEDITIGVEQLKDAFNAEDIVGRNERPRRRRGGVVDTKGAEDWDVLGSASETVTMNGAKYFVVRRNNSPISPGGNADTAKRLDGKNLEGLDLEEPNVAVDTMNKTD